MVRYVLTTWQWLPRPRDEVFPFFADAHNLERITPALLRFRVLTPAPIAMRAGALIDYRLRLRGIPIRWQTEITGWDPPSSFHDRQRRGPYAEWLHAHTFTEEDGGTMIRDEVRYRLRGPAILSGLVNAWLVAPDSRRIFEFRQEAIERVFDVRGRSRKGSVATQRLV